MVEESPFKVSPITPEEVPADSANEERMAMLGVSVVLLRAQREAAELLERARVHNGDLNEKTTASSTVVSLTKSNANGGNK